MFNHEVDLMLRKSLFSVSCDRRQPPLEFVLLEEP